MFALLKIQTAQTVFFLLSKISIKVIKDCSTIERSLELGGEREHSSIASRHQRGSGEVSQMVKFANLLMGEIIKNKHKICAKVRKIIQSQDFLSKF